MSWFDKQAPDGYKEIAQPGVGWQPMPDGEGLINGGTGVIDMNQPMYHTYNTGGGRWLPHLGQPQNNDPANSSGVYTPTDPRNLYTSAGPPTSHTYTGGAGPTQSSWTDQGAPDPRSDPEGYVNELLRRAGYNTPSPEGLAAIEPYLTRNGMHLQRNSAGQIRGRVYIGQGYDNHFDVMGAQNFVPGQGGGAVGALGGMLGSGDVANDPSFQFRLQEGQKALERSAAAKGTLLTGGTAKALTRYAQDYASGEYQNIYNRLMGVAGLGLSATNSAANLGSGYAGNIGQNNYNYGNQYSNLTTQQGNANAQNQANQGNIWGGTIGNIANAGIDWATRRRAGKAGGDYEWQGPIQTEEMGRN